MSLVPSPITNVYQQLENENSRLERENASLRAQVRELNIQLAREREKSTGVGEGAQRLKNILSPLHTALKMIFEELDGVEVPTGTQSNPVWDDWKKKLGGKSAEAIDVLMMHGELNADQLRIHLHCARTHVYNVISQLNKAGVIIKNGGRISLKKL